MVLGRVIRERKYVETIVWRGNRLPAKSWQAVNFDKQYGNLHNSNLTPPQLPSEDG
jgi:hypothetical protein